MNIPTPSSHRLRLALCFAVLMSVPAAALHAATPVVRVSTVLGEFFIELTPQQAPATVENFLGYVRRGDYDGSFIHRVPDPDFVVQGGGFSFTDENGVAEIPPQPPVHNEFNVSNLRGTVAMARLGGQPDSATSQWFVNITDNAFLDTVDGGFTVFGTVSAEDMGVPDAIAALPIVNAGSPFNELPVIDLTGTTITSENLVNVTAVEEFERLTPPSAAVLPAARSVQVDATASAFATLINTGSSTAASCRLTPPAGLPAGFSYQATDPLTNQPTGPADAPVDISAGAAQTFVFSLTPLEAFETSVELGFRCGNSDRAPVIMGVNTLALSASVTPVADVIALAATASNDGVVRVPGEAGTGAFSVATINVGVAETVNVSADTGDASLPVTVFVCETDPLTALCLDDPVPTLSSSVGAGQASTFSFFVVGAGTVPFDPGTNRIFARFVDAAGRSRGATSVAVLTEG